MDKDFCNYNQSMRLKALGFNEPCLDYFANGSPQNSWCISYNSDDNLRDFESVARPTFSQAFRWFRKKYELTWEHTFDDSQIQLYIGEVAYPDNCLDFFKSIEVKYDCYNEAYEEAESACLDKLIEIVESKVK